MKASSDGPGPITRADRIRERELFRYYRPTEADVAQEGSRGTEAIAARQTSSPDTTLTALAQLVALRVDVKSVLIK